MKPRTAFLFPGQGSYVPGLFCELFDHWPVIDEVLATVDEVAVGLGRTPVSRLLLHKDSPTLQELVDDDPPALHLAIFAASITAFRLLVEEGGMSPDVLLGHSFGELTALTAAGALSLSDGAHLVARRDESLRRADAPRGGLVAVDCGARRARGLLGAVDEWKLSVAVDNGPDQVVISGPDEALAGLQDVCGAIGLPATRLRVPYPFHNRLLLDAADDFAARTAEVPKRVPRLPVYSSVLARYVDDVADVEQVIRGHLVMPVRFLEAVRAVHADGVRGFVEAGPKGVLVNLVSRIVPDVVTVAPLRQRADRRTVLSAVADFLAGSGNGRQPARVRTVSAPVPSGHRSDRIGDAGGRDREERPAAPRDQEPATAPTPTRQKHAPVAAVNGRGPGLDRDEVLEAVRRLYADMVGYPPDVFDNGSDLEADLGIDSIKQTEAFTRICEHFGVSESATDVRLTSYPTVDAIADLVVELAGDRRELTGTVV